MICRVAYLVTKTILTYFLRRRIRAGYSPNSFFEAIVGA